MDGWWRLWRGHRTCDTRASLVWPGLGRGSEGELGCSRFRYSRTMNSRDGVPPAAGCSQVGLLGGCLAGGGLG